MSIHEYRLVAAGWFVLILFLTLFWYATLRRLAEVLKEQLSATRSRGTVPGFFGLAQYLIRAEYKSSKDARFVEVCKKLRQLLYGYLGGVGAYIVFLILFRPHY